MRDEPHVVAVQQHQQQLARPLAALGGDRQRAQRQRHRGAEQDQDRRQHADDHVLHHVHAEHDHAVVVQRGAHHQPDGQHPGEERHRTGRRPAVAASPQPHHAPAVQPERQHTGDQEERVRRPLEPAPQRERRQIHGHPVSAVVHPPAPAPWGSCSAVRTRLEPPPVGIVTGGGARARGARQRTVSASS